MYNIYNFNFIIQLLDEIEEQKNTNIQKSLEAIYPYIHKLSKFSKNTGNKLHDILENNYYSEVDKILSDEKKKGSIITNTVKYIKHSIII